MDQSWRVILLAVWLLILWAAETVYPLRRNDRAHLLTNLVFTLLTVTINALLIYALISVIGMGEAYSIGLFHVVDMPFALKVLISLLVLDLFAAYFSHRVMHLHGLFWSYHKVHHLDEMVDVTTGLRQHPFETLHRFAFLVLGVVILGAPLSIVVIYQTISALNALLEHTNIKLNDKWDRLLSLVVITPNFHKVHHSVDLNHSNANFGNIFSVWDRLFGTYRRILKTEELTYGIAKSTRPALPSLLMLAEGKPSDE